MLSCILFCLNSCEFFFSVHVGSQRCVPPRGKRRWSGVKRVNRKNARGDAPMHLAAKKGNLNKIKSLLEKGADVNTQCFAGKATLTWAHFFSFYEVLHYMQGSKCVV